MISRTHIIKRQGFIFYSYNGRQHIEYEIHAIVELTLFLSEDKKCMSLLSLLKEIYHTSFILVAKKHRLQIRNSHLLTIISGK